MIKMLRILFFPLAIIYGLVMAVRNLLFNVGLLKSCSFDVPLISLGNITAGGTGKTPHVEYILDIISAKAKMAVLSRGYGRETRGHLDVQLDSTPQQCGDEPCQIKRKYPKHHVVVNENRCDGINRIIEDDEFDAILLDDAYQHRWVKPGLSILLVDYTRPIFKDFILPTGNLRECATGSKRANVIIVTKCPADITAQQKETLAKRLRIKSHQTLYFSVYDYAELQPVFEGTSKVSYKNSEVLLLSGIANPKPLLSFLESNGAKVSLMSFKDHYQFSPEDVKAIESSLKAMSDGAIVITTEKDAVRLKAGLKIETALQQKMYYLPIKVRLLEGEEVFHKIIEDYVAKD